ncbi:alpha-L-glutamate ligase [Sphingomonas sp.]|uniref:ATP-grasp domain-containing protein n=1 Tax=Sphingomonas sp. TaxID=28214 RepID=UPI00286B695C|nr:alpha-L-glutamate ligase [Sphingomonas sp.]
MMTASLAILYEHPAWFEPLFAALDRRGVDFVKVHSSDHRFDPAGSPPPAPLIFNRVAMSSFLRDADHSIFYTMALLDHWRGAGARVINGPEAMAIDASKARQLSLIERLGFATPRTRAVHRARDVVAAAQEIGFPLLVKANVGGSGAGITRFSSLAELEAAAADTMLPTSIDNVLLVQAYATARGGKITRVETLAGKFLYAIDINVDDSGFDLCPADACQIPGRSLTMTSVTPPAEQIAAAEAIVQAAGIDIGGVEYVIDDADGMARFYDINGLSNFVAKPLDVLGWDPHERLVDHLETLIRQKEIA